MTNPTPSPAGESPHIRQGPAAPAGRLRALLTAPGLVVVPGCYDALTARLIERAGFPLAFMGGFAVSGARLGLPDTGLISYAEMLDQGRDICAAVSIPVIGDGDTGHGNALNVRRTVDGFARAGFACVMIEDQLAPKRCGHTKGKQVVGRDEALMRVQAAVDARAAGADICVLARTDARATDGFDEALWRVRQFAKIGADLVFLEAPKTEDEMRRFCAEAPAPAVANMVEGGETPILPPERLAELGFKLAIYPLTLISAAAGAMQAALAALHAGSPPGGLLGFAELRNLVGFDEYYAAETRYAPGA